METLTLTGATWQEDSDAIDAFYTRTHYAGMSDADEYAADLAYSDLLDDLYVRWNEEPRW